MITAVKHNKSLALLLMLVVATVISMEIWKTQTSTLLIETTRDAGFVLNDLRIQGIERTKRNNILSVLDVDDGMPLLSVDLEALQKRIEALPWVKRAEVSRILPGGLNISVIECEPFALLQTNGSVDLIDPDGMIITNKGLGEFSHLPLLVGNITQREISHYSSLAAIDNEISKLVKSAVRVGGRRWDIILNNGIRIKLPEDAALAYNAFSAWEKFVRLNNQYNLIAREISVIDLRTPDRLILRITPEGQRQMAGKEKAL